MFLVDLKNRSILEKSSKSPGLQDILDKFTMSRFPSTDSSILSAFFRQFQQVEFIRSQSVFQSSTSTVGDRNAVRRSHAVAPGLQELKRPWEMGSSLDMI
jgi:hypothetical protein